MAAQTVNRLAKNIGLLTGSQLITWSLTLVWTIFVPRLLGPDGMGLLVMAWSASGIFVAIGGLGLRTLLVKEIAADPSRAPSLLGAAMVIRAACILPCLIITALYVWLGHFHGNAIIVIWLAAATAVFLLFLEPLQSAFQAIEQMQYLALTDVLNKVLLTGGGIALVLAGFEATSLVILTLVAAAVVLVLNVAWSRRYVRIDWSMTRPLLRSVFFDSFPYWGFAVFLSIYLWIASAMLAVMTTPTVVGWYGVPSKLFGTLLVVPTILFTAWLPKLVAGYVRGPENLKRVAKAPVELVTTLSLPISIGAVLIAEPVIRILYGRAYLPSVPVFQVLALTVIPMYVGISINHLLIASNRQMVWTKALGVASIVNPVLNFFLIRYFQDHSHNGALGAALSLLITEVLMVAFGLAVIHPLIHVESVGRWGRAAAATAGMAGVALLAQRSVVAEVVAGTITFAVLAVVFRVVPTARVKQARRAILRLAVGGRVHGLADLPTRESA